MKQKAKQLREMSENQLEALKAELQGQLRQFRFLVRHGELKQVHKINEVKTTLARITMVLYHQRKAGQADSLTEESKQA